MTINESGGISKQNRILLDKLNREAKAPLNTSEIAQILGMPIEGVRGIITYWVTRGWLTRIKRGLFTTVPLGAIKPGDRKEDPWIIAGKIFEPCYIGGWSACEHWGLTDQLYKDLIVFTQRRLNRRKVEIQNVTYITKKTNKSLFFGLKPVWRGQVKIQVSDQARTIVDILNDPFLGGGIRSVSNILEAYYYSNDRDNKKLIAYVQQFGNRTIYKRLGYLLEAMNIKSEEILSICSKNKSSGYSLLDPDLPPKGKLSRKWNLRINAYIQTNQS